MGKARELPSENIIIFFQTESDMPKDAFSFDGRKTPNLRSLFIKADKLWNSGNPINPNNDVYYRCMSILYQIMAEISAMLLRNHQMTISQIAEMCGYENVYYFSNAFKNYFGYPPTKMK